MAQPGELLPIEDTPALWGELLWAAREEGVVHLEDLLLRRLRIGLLLPQGALAIMDRIRDVVQPELGWDDARWKAEVAAYQTLWAKAYSPPTAV
jgi:glycerol-3-phosphate dehydrogenase